ncbi:MAG: hypothetical protein R2991_02330 [Thermoanaerobaculia bacterium]
MSARSLPRRHRDPALLAFLAAAAAIWATACGCGRCWRSTGGATSWPSG